MFIDGYMYGIDGKGFEMLLNFVLYFKWMVWFYYININVCYVYVFLG